VWLVTLSGPGGSGKTRLALEIAFALVPHFADGVFFVDLTSLRDPALVLPTIARTLGLQETPGQSIEERLQHYLQGKQLLLVLDNFEQVVAAALRLAELHSQAPGLTLLVTSRVLLRLRGGKELPVPSLSLPEGVETIENVAQSEAVQLFVERVLDVQPGFALTESNAATVAAICTQLDGLPLAIELAAARCNLLNPQTLLAGLAEPLRLLTRGARDLPDRQQTLRATIAWSYNLLAAEEQILFCRLAIFTGGFTLPAVEAVCNTAGVLPDVLDGLSLLLDKNLVRAKTTPAGEQRFLLLETIREFALEQLTAANEATLLHRRHADYFLNLAATAELYMNRREKKLWLERLQGDYGNLRAALEWFIATDAPAAQHMARLLWRFWEASALQSEGCNWLAKALAADSAPTCTRAWALWAAGHLTDDFQCAQQYAQECLTIFQAQGDPTGCCEALSLMGYALMNAEQGAQALSYLEQGLALARQSGQPQCLAHALVGLGDVYLGLGRPPAEILPLLEESAEIYDEMGDLQGFAYTFHVKARTHMLTGDYAQGVTLCQQALAINREMGSQLDVAYVLTTLGYASWRAGDRVGACTYWGEAYQFFLAADHRPMLKEVEYSFEVIAHYLLEVASVTLTHHVFDGTTRLLSAVQKILDNQPPFLDIVALEKYQEMLATLGINYPESTFASLWAEGQKLTLAEAVALALTLSDAPASAPANIKLSLMLPPPKTYPAGLTEREVEVLRLLAQRLTYAQIAEQLIISRRTVNAHITSIYSKLGVKAREAAIRFAIEYYLL
jgi:predicted ATPase/DNA-binding CsgD family transcriptional regulator